jgi:hypothetical protein
MSHSYRLLRSVTGITVLYCFTSLSYLHLKFYDVSEALIASVIKCKNWKNPTKFHPLDCVSVEPFP